MYVTHYSKLKLDLKLGMKLTKLHRAIEFNQKPWLKKYIDFNIDKREVVLRRTSSNVMSNSAFRKTTENLRKRVDVRLVSDNNFLIIYNAMKIFSENLVAINLKKINL